MTSTDTIKQRREKSMRLVKGTRFPDFDTLTKEHPRYQYLLIEALNYANYVYEYKELADFAKKFCKDQFQLNLNHIPDYDLPAIGAIAWVTQNGGYVSDSAILTYKAKAEKLLERYKSLLDEPKKSTAQHIEEQHTKKLIAELDGLLDDIVFLQNGRDMTIKKLIDAFPKANKQKVLSFFKRSLDRTEDEADQETISNLNKKELQLLQDFKEELFGELESTTSSTGSVKQRKPRKQKAPKKLNPTKLVRRLNFLQEFKELNLVSFKPEKIIFSKILFVYNTKTRKLMRFVAKDETGLMVKGSKVISFDETESYSKTLRKPEKTIPELMGAGKIEQRRIMEALTTTPGKLNGSVTRDCILLKLY